jgi:hypothetical protein
MTILPPDRIQPTDRELELIAASTSTLTKMRLHGRFEEALEESRVPAKDLALSLLQRDAIRSSDG